MRLNGYIIILILTLCFSGCNMRKPGKTDRMEIYLLIGQSNMSGRAELRESDLDTLHGVYLLTNDSLNRWEPAANPLNKYSTIGKRIEMQKLGPGYAFAKQMLILHPDQEIGLVVNARGGTSIREWMPGTTYYNEAIRRTKLALEDGTFRGILWLQGEADTRRADIYLDSLIKLIEAFRSDFNIPDLPFIACELSGDKPHREPFNIMLGDLPVRLDHTAVISSAGTATIDSTHFNAESQQILGERFAEKMSVLLKN